MIHESLTRKQGGGYCVSESSIKLTEMKKENKEDRTA